jgi:hypothetical protein
MADVYEGNGVDFTFSGLTLDVKTIEIPGFTQEEIDISTLSNTSVKTKYVAALKDYEKLVMNLNYDPSVTLPTTEQALVISVPGEGSITYYAKISEAGSVTFNNDEQPILPVSFTITNLNSGVETPPAFST